METYSTFAGEALKSNVGSPEWMRFFALVSSAIAIYENSPCVPSTASTIEDLRPELTTLYEKLNVWNVLSGYSAGAKLATDKEMWNADVFLLVLDPDEFTVTVSGYSRDQLIEANEEYAKIEKESPQFQSVLVSADSLNALRLAYPNYFLDTAEFLRVVHAALGGNDDAGKSDA
ncbi:MAG TPA: hypothetical protein VF126_00565 [Acidobacteriaceae bacterium]